MSIPGAGGENRTLIVCLEGRHISHYTTPARLRNYIRFYVIIKSMRINRFVNNRDITKPFHSSGYAKVANGDQLGATSPESFNTRLSIDKNRKTIHNYRESLVAQGQRRPIASVDNVEAVIPTPPDNPRQKANVRSLPAVGRGPIMPSVPRDSFREPPARNYDPFGR